MVELRPQTRRDAYVAQRGAQVDRLLESLGPLEARVANATGEGRASLEAEVVSLHALARAAARQLDAVRAADPTRWDGAMAEMDEAWQAFRRAANYFQSRL